MEYFNKSNTTYASILGIASYVKTLLKLYLTALELAHIAEETGRLLSKSILEAEEHPTKMQPVQHIKFRRKHHHEVSSEASVQQIIPNIVQESILQTKQSDKEVFLNIVKEYFIWNMNMWSKMTIAKLYTCISSANDIKLKAGSEVNASYFAQVLIIAQYSQHYIDLEEVTDRHEISTIN